MRAREGDTVQVHYTGRFPDGTIFDSSHEKCPMEIRLGKGEVIEGFERAIIGMKIGGFAIENVPAVRAFGPFRREMVWIVDRDSIHHEGALDVGMEVEVRTRSGKVVPVRIVEENGPRVKVDANHPLAGKDLTFEIELLEVLGAVDSQPSKVPDCARDSMIILPAEVIAD